MTIEEKLYRITIILNTLLSPCRMAISTPEGDKKREKDDPSCLCCVDKGGWRNCSSSSYDPTKDEITYQLKMLTGE